MRIGKSLQDAWNLFLKAPEIFICLTLVYAVANIAFARIPGVGLFGGILLPALFLPVFLTAASEVRHTGKARMETLKSSIQVFPQLVVMLLIKYLILIVGAVFLVIPAIYFGVAYLFAEFFCVLEKKTFWESLEASRALVKGRWWPTLGLVIVTFLLFFCGAMVLLVGLLVAVPLAMLLLYCAFEDLRGRPVSIDASPAEPGVIDAEIVP